jgi:protein-disulfide isomerase
MQEENTQPTTSPEKTSSNKLSVPQAIIFGAVIIGIALIIAFGKGGATTSQKFSDDTFTLGEEKVTETPTLTFSPENEDEHIRGNRDADVFLVEYSDIDCPFCRRFHPVMEQLMTAYGKDVAWVYRQFPLTSLHPDAYEKAKATECVAQVAGNDAFWTYLDTLFVTEVTPEQLSATAVAQGVDKAAFDACMASDEIEAKIEEDIASGKKAGVQGTPFTAVINVKTKEQGTLPGALPFEQATTIIDGILEK